jgi:hypothetical protein
MKESVVMTRSLGSLSDAQQYTLETCTGFVWMFLIERRAVKQRPFKMFH